MSGVLHFSNATIHQTQDIITKSLEVKKSQEKTRKKFLVKKH